MKDETQNTSKKIKLFPLFLFVISFLTIETFLSQKQTKKITLNELKDQIDKNNVKNIKVKGDEVFGEYKNPNEGKINFKVLLAKKEISDQLSSFKIDYTVEREKSGLGEILTLLLPTFLFFLLWYLLMRKSFSKIGNTTSLFGIGKTKAKVFLEKDTRITFKDVAGADEVITELKEIIDFLKNHEKVKALGGKMPKGILLVGAPGTGKTLIAKAMAGEAGVPFFSCSGSEFVEMFVGVGAARVRDLFNEAKKINPCVIFIDELDALGKMRQVASFGGNEEKEQTLNQLLVEMDGFDTEGGIIILAATNRPEMIDPALLRAGRFDRQIVVDRPDKKGRKEILTLHLNKTKHDPHLDIDKIASLTPGLTGADLANLVNESALLATREMAKEINENHFTLALERMFTGLEKKNKVLNPEERKVVAVHELGHAMLGYFFQKEDKIHKVSIIPHGMSTMGYTIQRPGEDKFIFTKDQLLKKMMTLLGGRCAEYLIFNEISTGASDDLTKATNIAFDMITKFGMGKEIGLVTYEVQKNIFIENSNQYFAQKISDQTLYLIDKEVKKLMDQIFIESLHFLEINKDILLKTMDILLKQETLSENELTTYFKSLKSSEEEENVYLS